MSRRRKRKKERAAEGESELEKEPLLDREIPSPEPASPPASQSADLISESAPEPSTPAPASTSEVNELDLELSDDFDDAPAEETEVKSTLPTSASKTNLREIRRAELPPSDEPNPPHQAGASAQEEKAPAKIGRMRRSVDMAIQKPDRLGELDEDDLTLEPEPSPTTEPEPARSDEPSLEPVADQSTPEKPSPSEPTLPETSPPRGSNQKDYSSLITMGKDALGSLSILEQASLGLLFVTLLAGAIWSSSVVAARIPNTVIVSKLKYPLKGESVVIAELDSYWRSPIREGDDTDEGVSESIEIIPEIQITIAPESTAKALRFLFRDEEGNYVGDSSTVELSGGNFLPASDVTTSTQGNVATIHSTTGFQHEGELISYLADEKFQWEFVILESKDGREYNEFMAIPISARRKDSQ
ncbi:hypothetical protein [Roseibacillus persicicus]|uniref:Uncharacterized protein n=1 Tax=Roseibacillus persicicus TaxID=454148 RepID=A0A918TW83_9BACT|nr:hypothetical protein [Roseibacillus persicicus]GHC65984.1 hypothetical protein GCM10007100_37220 [Roseibacillus persicicus]